MLVLWLDLSRYRLNTSGEPKGLAYGRRMDEQHWRLRRHRQVLSRERQKHGCETRTLTASLSLRRLIGALTCVAACSNVTARPFTVADDIGFTVLDQPCADSRDKVVFSPDRKHF